MDPVKNPFSPGAGAPPPELVGRDPILERSRILLARIKAGRPEKSILLTGLRGVGKTVLLTQIERIASSAGYHAISLEAHEDKQLGPLIAAHLRGVLFKFDQMGMIAEKVKRGLRVLRSFVGALKLTVGDVTLGLDIDPETGAADSGDLEIDLPNLFVAIAEAARERKSAIALLIDEIQYFSQKELGALIMAMHRIQQRQLPIVLVGAGLPILPALAGESKSYAERLFDFPEIGALSEADANRALQDPAKAVGAKFDAAALKLVHGHAKGYPYFIQEWGYQAWNEAPSTSITASVIKSATPVVIARLDQGFFRVRFDRLTPRERRYLRAIAEFGAGPQRTGDVAELLRRQVQATGTVRAGLIKKGMIYSPGHGLLAFTVPLFDEFMVRAMPKLERD